MVDIPRTCQRFSSHCGDLVSVLEVEGEESSDCDVVEQRLEAEFVVEDEGVGRGGVLHEEPPEGVVARHEQGVAGLAGAGHLNS